MVHILQLASCMPIYVVGISTLCSAKLQPFICITVLPSCLCFHTINPEPPSAPHNLQVLQVSTTTVRLSWDPPVSNGGRDDLEYQLSYQIVTSSELVTIYGRVNMTEGQITGLRPFTQYVVFVST